MKKNKEANTIGFEKLREDKDKIVYKRVLPKKNVRPKEKGKLELQLPTLTVHLFDPVDLEKLQKVFNDLIEKMEQEKNQKKQSALGYIKNLLIQT